MTSSLDDMTSRASVGVDVDLFPTAESVANWLIVTCRLYGAGLHTALLVAGTFLSDPLIRERWEPGLLASLDAEAAARVEAQAARRRRRHESAVRGAETRKARRG